MTPSSDHSDNPADRSSGILLHITSLPSRYGIGDLGENAYRFVDFLAESGQHLWQILPLTHPGLGHSPYHSFSAFAGNPYLIDPDNLVMEELLTREDLAELPAGFSDEQVNYEEVLPWKEKLLEKAAARFFVEYSELTSQYKRNPAGVDPMRLMLFQDFERFTLREQDWLNGYALKMASSAEGINYYLFVQFIFDRQMRALRRYANRHGVKLIGDIPIYVAPDSADVWTHPELFRLDKSGKPSMIAGVPPDYFSDVGQLWNNPLYDWDGHGRELTGWWVGRILRHLDYCDYLRLDHFRGFESFWAVPAGSEDARSGHWEKGPGAGFFEIIRAVLADQNPDRNAGSSDPDGAARYPLPLIAEDLGDITDDVRQMLADTGLPGMKVLQFAFDSEDSTYLPHRYGSGNCVCYTGTHDNNTTRGWYEKADETVRSRAAGYMAGFLSGADEEREAISPDSITDETVSGYMIRLAMSSKAQMALFPMQDVLGLGSEARMNVPGTAEGNWRWRFSWSSVPGDTAAKLKSLAEQYRR